MKLICLVIGHRWRFHMISLERHKIWRCDRCEKIAQGAMVRPTSQVAHSDGGSPMQMSSAGKSP